MPDAFPQTRNPTGLRPMRWDENARIFRSPLSGGDQTMGIWGRWIATFEYDGLDEDDALPILSFCEYVGMSSTFTLLHPTLRNPRSAWSHANGLVQGGSQTGKSLATDGWPNNTLILKNGDLVELPSIQQVVRMRADITSNGSGLATLLFSQTMRTSPGDNTAVVVVNPKFTMKLVRPVGLDMLPPTISSFTVEMAEDI